MTPMNQLPRRERFRRDQRRAAEPSQAKPIAVAPPPPREYGPVGNWAIRWWLTFAGILLAPLATVLIYLPAMSGRMIWDDYYYLQAPDAVVRDTHALQKIWLEPKANLQYYPVTFMVFYWEQKWMPVFAPGASDIAKTYFYPSQQDYAPPGYHWVNVLIHAANVLLLWAVLAMLRIRGSWAVALLFGLHPLNVESVAWISELKNVWSAVFALTALLAYMKFRPIAEWPKPEAAAPSQPVPADGSDATGDLSASIFGAKSPPPSEPLLTRIFGSTPTWTQRDRSDTVETRKVNDPKSKMELLSILGGWRFLVIKAILRFFSRLFTGKAESSDVCWAFYGLALLLGIAAILAKASMIALPAVILLLVWWKRGRFDWRDLLAVLPLVAVGMCVSPIVKELENRGIWETARWAHMTPVEKVLVAGRALWFYLRQILCPNHLMAVYPRWDLNGGMWWQWLFPIGFVALLAVLWLLRKRIGRGPLTAVLLMAGTIAPVLGFFFVSYIQDYAFVADHFLYLSMVGILAVAVAAVARLADRCDAWRKEMGLSAWPSLLGPALVLAGGAVWWIDRSWTFFKGGYPPKPENPPFGQTIPSHLAIPGTSINIPLPWPEMTVPDAAAVMIVAAGVAAVVIEGLVFLIGRAARGGMFDRLHGAMSRTRVALLVGVIAIFASNSIRHEHLLHDWDTLWSTTAVENPDNAKGHFCIGVYSLIQDSDVARSMKQMDKSLDLKVSHIFLAYYYRALAFMRMGDLDTAEKEYTRGVEASPNVPTAWANRAGFYRDRGLAAANPDERVRWLTLALADMDSAIEAMHQPHPVAHDWLDSLTEKLGIAKKSDPETDPLLRTKSIVYFHRAQAYQTQGNVAATAGKSEWYALALKDYDSAIRSEMGLASPQVTDLVAYYRSRASLYMQLTDWKAALPDLFTCLRLSPYPDKNLFDCLGAIRNVQAKLNPAATQPGG